MPCAHVGLGESGHIGAHREDAISTARPRLLERLVVMLVEAGALIAEKHQLARPLSRIRKQLAHHLDVLCGRRRDDHLVLVAHHFLACGQGHLRPLGAFALKVGHRRAADFHHIEEHAVVEPRGDLGLEHTVF